MNRKNALCIGINNYPGSGSDLTGCVNDANAWADELTRRGFLVQRLLDSDATGKAITDFIESIVTSTEWGDIGVVTYSGHGSWTPDVSGDEPDRRDEGLVPHDYAEFGLVLDDQLHELFAERKQGARLVMISDSCHSGTVARFAAPTFADRPRVRYLPPEVHLLDEVELDRARAVASTPPRGKSRPTALLMSGCADTEYSYDGYGSHRMGAFSVVALAALRRLDDDATYADWHRVIRESLPAEDVPQTPQLSATRAQRDWEVFAAMARD